MVGSISRRRAMLGLAALAGAALLSVFGLVAPPAAADDSTSKKLWSLTLEPGRVRKAKVGREPEITNYWYVPFHLKNEDQEDHSFFLDVSATSDKSVEYRNLAQPQVKEIARKRLGIRETAAFWDVADLTTKHEATDTAAAFPRKLDLPVIKAGERVPCIAIFRGPDPEADRISVTFRGLSNDVQALKTGKPNERRLIERAYVLDFVRPGDEFHRDDDSIELTGHRWVTIERLVKTDLE